MSAGKNQRIEPQLVLLRFIQGNGNQFVRKNSLQGPGYSFEKVVKLQKRRNGVVNLQQDPKTVTLFDQCLLVTLDFIKVTGVIYGDGYLVCDAPQERHLRIGEVPRP